MTKHDHTTVKPESENDYVDPQVSEGLVIAVGCP